MAQRSGATTSGEVRRARAECFLLCDFARAENGKLYLIGGGWDHIVPKNLPMSYDVYLATKLVLPGVLLKDLVQVRVDLLDSNEHVIGEPVLESAIESDSSSSPDEFGDTLHRFATLLMADAIRMDLTQPGRYILRLLVNDEQIASTSFIVSPVPVVQES